jgi:hypothetical protein
MRICIFFRYPLCLLLVAVCLQAQKPPVKDAPPGLPPRVSAAEYTAAAKSGAVTIAAEFVGHAAPTPQATFTTEEYIGVEVGIFGAAGARATLAESEFSLRVNGKKQALPSQPWGLVVKNLKDPEWEAAQLKPGAPAKSKTGVGGGGGGGGQEDAPAPPPKMTIEERRAMELKLQKSALPEGDRALPIAGLIFFRYGGKTNGIKQLELVYEGAAGKAVIPLQ